MKCKTQEVDDQFCNNVGYQFKLISEVDVGTVVGMNERPRRKEEPI